MRRKTRRQQPQQNSPWDEYSRDHFRLGAFMLGVQLLQELEIEFSVRDVEAAVNRMLAPNDKDFRREFNKTEPAGLAWLETMKINGGDEKTGETKRPGGRQEGH